MGSELVLCKSSSLPATPLSPTPAAPDPCGGRGQSDGDGATIASEVRANN